MIPFHNIPSFPHCWRLCPARLAPSRLVRHLSLIQLVFTHSVGEYIRFFRWMYLNEVLWWIKYILAVDGGRTSPYSDLWHLLDAKKPNDFIAWQRWIVALLILVIDPGDRITNLVLVELHQNRPRTAQNSSQFSNIFRFILSKWWNYYTFLYIYTIFIVPTAIFIFIAILTTFPLVLLSGHLQVIYVRNSIRNLYLVNGGGLF